METITKKQTMKKILALTLAFSAIVFSADAQHQRTIKKDKNKMERHEGHMGERKDMMQDLNLSDAQKNQLRASREEYKIKMEQLKAQGLTGTEFAERRKALAQEQKAKMQAILTAEQRAKIATQKNEIHHKGKHDGKHAEKGKMIKEKLSLSDDQAAKLKAQHSNLKSQKAAIKNDNTLSAEAKKEKMKALKGEAKSYTNNILTPEQIKKMETLKKEHKNKNLRKTKK